MLGSRAELVVAPTPCDLTSDSRLITLQLDPLGEHGRVEKDIVVLEFDRSRALGEFSNRGISGRGVQLQGCGIVLVRCGVDVPARLN